MVRTHKEDYMVLNPDRFTNDKLTSPSFIMSVLQTPLASVLISGALLVYIIHFVLLPTIEPIRHVSESVNELSTELKQTNRTLKNLNDGQGLIIIEMQEMKNLRSEQGAD